jgi:hypothetical protein
VTALSALVSLQDCRRHLANARLEGVQAANHLDGARLARAQQLNEMIADAIAHVERLAFVVEGDCRADPQVTRGWIPPGAR